MPKVINQDIIEKIATYAGKGYSKADTARETGLDRKTVGKYWPKGKKPEVKKEDEEAKPKLSIEQEFDLLTKKKQTELVLEDMEIEVDDTEGETKDTIARREVIQEQIKALGERLEKVESVADVDEVRELAARVKDDVTALLAVNAPLRQQREERQEKEHREREEKEKKKREEDIARRNRLEQTLRALRLSDFAWVFPCSREQAKKIVNRFIFKVGDAEDPIISSLDMVGEQLHIAAELKWESDTTDLKPLINECVNLLKGNSEEKQRITIIMHARKAQILISSDEDLRKKFVDLLSAETNKNFVEMVLKFNAALSRLAEERFIDTEELLNKETVAGTVVG
ncbi:hypothetical protein ES703_39520 [subsurface metagenome]